MLDPIYAIHVTQYMVAAPIAMSIAEHLQVNPDTMLMGVAVAASCAFLSPIGHKNNTIIMEPGAIGLVIIGVWVCL